MSAFCTLASRQKRPMSDANRPVGEGSKEDSVPCQRSNNEFSIEKYRGSRKLQDMTIETFSNVGKSSFIMN